MEFRGGSKRLKWHICLEQVNRKEKEGMPEIWPILLIDHKMEEHEMPRSARIDPRIPAMQMGYLSQHC